MPNIPQNINQVQQRLAKYARKAGRNAADITLLAVSKGQPAEAVRTALAAGLHRFGENYLQEALDKIAAIDDSSIEWHFSGPLQSNKTGPVAEQFDWVHTVDRLKIARRLSRQRPAGTAPLNVCLQVNIDDQASKSGVSPDDTLPLAEAVADLPGLALRGLMTIPAPRHGLAAQREPFFRLTRLLDRLKDRLPGAPLDTLSMGMSGDMEAAVLEGATVVRVGTAIFGPRQTGKR